MSVMVQVSELSFAARDGHLILEDVHLRVERGEVVFLVGPSGSGKTLLFALLTRELRPCSGQILVNDRNITRIGAEKLRVLRQQIGIVPQRPCWPRRLTVEENLRFKLNCLNTPWRQAEHQIEETLNLLGLQVARARRFPELNELERLTAYLALAICHDPVLLLCDDPFEGLDEEAVTTLLDTLQRVHAHRGLTALISSRRAEIARRFGTRIAFLEGGSLRIEDLAGRTSVEER